MNKSAKITKSFNDAGTNERFEAGSTVSIPKGQFDNYRAAGLADAAPSGTKAEKPSASDEPSA